MSAVSPHFVHSDPTTDRNLDHELSNLYLSASADPEEADFQSSGIRRTPVDDQCSAWNGSTCPLEHGANNASTPSNNEGYATPYDGFLSSQEDLTSEFSGYASPAALTMSDVWPATATSVQNIKTPGPDQHGSVSSHAPSPQTTMDPSQLLTPNLSSHPSPSSDTNSHESRRASRSTHFPQMPRLITTPLTNTLGPGPVLESTRPISPNIKVETYSRGDSPVRDSLSTNRRPSQSSVHLSPGGMSNASQEDAASEPEGLSVSRTPDGAWIPHAATGQAGIAPDSRADFYVPSPNEMEAQRKLLEKNSDIYTWSISVARSESGEDYAPSRGRTDDHHGTRRRAKSTGDPSLHQQDYFNLKTYNSQLDIPGPGLVLYERSEISDNETESSAPVSVNEERWAQEASDVTPPEPQISETGEPLPHQFLGSPPWRDIEYSRSPSTTQNQPASSAQAMVEYSRRALEMDAQSRVATWGTRDVDVNSLRSFPMPGLDGDKRRHKRQNSLLKYLPGNKINPLKRPHQRTDLSAAQQVPEVVVAGAESKPAPQRKDSFPHRKLSLSLSSFKTRGRSKSEVPNLFELMTSHGGPPVPNIHYSFQATEDQDVMQAAPDHDAVGEEDSGGNDKEGVVMDFPIPSNLPVPTLQGFRAQIHQLNPRLAPALVERFAREQLRRYKRLVEIKQTHAQEVGHGKCKAGKFCFALNGEAKLLPPRASAQDADTYTQFLIPGRGEAEESQGAFGENAIPLAQFPPGVPYPPPQVKLLPAEFECMVCFHVKKFQKPSDWTKHIHEDVQPFTCTFPDCTDPKSFKRKADWVRHESERHRQLEWWECSVADCRHKCYRKDNFVQHLVREHKMPDPQIKKSNKRTSAEKKPNDLATTEMQEGINREQEVALLWDLVENCRHDTTKNPREEPCRFCGNVCTDWKKLTVHLAKHMEQMAIPILGLVDERHFSNDHGAGPSGKMDTCSGQLSIAQEPSGFTPHLNGVADGPGALNFTPAQYPSSHVGNSEALAVPTTYLPMTSMPMEHTEPDPSNTFNSVSPYTPHNTGLPVPSELAGVHTQLITMHQNSVTYPPPWNAGPRPRASNQDMRVLPEYNNYSMSPTEMQYDPNSEVYASSGAANHYSYHGPMASGVAYNPGGYPAQGQ